MKNHCREALERAYVLLDGETGVLSEGECIEIQTHLEECRPCFQRHQLDKQVIALIHRLQGMEGCPDELRSRIATLLKSL